MIESAFLAGVLIGIGDVALVTCENRYVGAFLFAVALLSIIKLKLPLYTGRIGRVVKDKTYIECISYLLFNIIGALFSAWWILVNNYSGACAVSEVKFSKTIPELIIAGVLCNVLIHIAVTVKNDLLTVLCVMTFILCGFEHCIADVPFIICSGKSGIEMLLMLFAVVLGNTIGGIFTETCIGDVV